MDSNNILLIIKKEAKESLKNRWFILYSICFAALALLLLFITSSESNIAGYSAFSRTAASLVNLVLLFIPLIALITGSISISGERENGTLSYLLSHPVTKSEVFLGKFVGLLISIWFSISLGFGLAGLAIAVKGGDGNVSSYLITAFLSSILAASLLSVGFIVSAFSSKTAKSIGIAVFLWLLFIVLGDLGIMGTTVAMDLGIEQVFVLALLNPAEVFKIASVLTLSPRLEVLGPVGVYAIKRFGNEGMFILLFSVMFLWVLLPFGVAFTSFCYRRSEE